MEKISYDGEVEIRPAVARVECRVLDSCLFERRERPGINGVGRPKRRAGVCDMVDVETGFLEGHGVTDEGANVGGEVGCIVCWGHDTLGREGEMVCKKLSVSCLSVLPADFVQE